jgi:hypothetical protein
MRTILIAFAGAALVSMAACNPSGPASSSGPASGAGSAAAIPSGPISPGDLPHLKAGLWKQTMTLDRANEPMPVSETCFDAAYAAKMSAFGAAMSKDRCASQSITRNLDGSMTFSSTCSIGKGQVTSHGTLTGSFDSGYTIVMDSTTTNAVPASINGERRMTITSVLEGPCPVGERGGDVTMTLPNGTKRTMNFGDLGQ